MRYTLKTQAKGSPAEEEVCRFAEVALNVPRLDVLTYSVPEPVAERFSPGLRVLVPLGRRRVTGYVTAELSDAPPEGVDRSQIKSIIEPLEDMPLLTPELMELTRWVADYYCCSWGEALRTALPGVKEKKSVEQFRLTEAGRREAILEAGGLGLPGVGAGDAPLRARLLTALRVRPRTLSALQASLGRGTRAMLGRLVEARFAERVVDEAGGSAPPKAKFVRVIGAPAPEEREALLRRAPKQADLLAHLEEAGERILLRDLEAALPSARGASAALAKKGWVAIEEDLLPQGPAPPGEGEEEAPAAAPRLTPEQRGVFDAVSPEIAEAVFSVTLLHGVTGSGKTEVYIRLAEEAVARERGALILVPEIGLTPQLLGRFRARLGDRVACLHSAYPESRRAAEWRRIRGGEASVVLGTRSAVFAPIEGLGFVAVDEEHDASYKQDDAPRYHARDTAIVRAQRAGAPVVLGSATPSIESYTRARSGRFRLHELPARAGGQPLPGVSVVDLRKEEEGGDPKRPPLLSRALSGAMATRLERGEQALLFLNRRGFSSVILCRECGEAAGCENCSVPLTFHRGGGGRMQCHLCDYGAPPPSRCTACGSDRVGYFGIGTERVEEAVRTRFPHARVQRMDRDTVRRAGTYERILGAMRRGEIDILIGTQMVAKGHDFPRLTLVGVVVADVGLHLPDFRAAERTFQLLTQVAGRAGRADLPGEVIIQTFRPGHYALTCAQAHDYGAFFRQEAAGRERVGYPPYRRLARLRFEAKGVSAAAKAGVWAASYLRRHGARPAGQGADAKAIEYLGPAPAALSKVRGVWRHHMILKARSAKRLGQALKALTDAFDRQKAFGSVQLIVDVDPQGLL